MDKIQIKFILLSIEIIPGGGWDSTHKALTLAIAD